MALWLLAPSILVLGSLALVLVLRRLDQAQLALRAQLVRVDDVEAATRSLRRRRPLR